MTKNLVIVESPTKANTIQKLLKDDFHVVSSNGHIVDLPEKTIGIDFNNNFQPNYVILPKKLKIVQHLKAIMNNYNIIWIASDEDREGEAIAYHIYKILNIPDQKVRRIVFHEITKNAILKAIQNPRQINYNLVYAQQARRIMDRLVGFQLSPILWKKINSRLSAGRVQSAVVRLIVDREQNIQKFTPVTGYKIYGTFTIQQNNNNNIILNAKFLKKIQEKNEVQSILSSCIKTSFFIKNIKITQKKTSPPPPFTTTSLQQEANQKLHFSIYKTMSIAQKLYEQGYITYIRTDSTHLSKDICKQITDFILMTYGKKYLSPKEFSYQSKFAQEAHESIHPTDINNSSVLNSLDTFQQLLYQLIWKRTIIGQMSDAIIAYKNFYIQSSNLEHPFIFSTKYMIFDGFMKIHKTSQHTEYNDIKIGTPLQQQEIIAKQFLTQHVPRYNEGSLVKTLENLGIGRPSTYVPIIYSIQKRHYVIIQKYIQTKNTVESLILKNNVIIQKTDNIINTEKNKFLPTEMGIIVTKFLKTNFHNIIDYNFTANLEKDFDDIAKGDKIWYNIIHNFYNHFNKKLKYVTEHVEKIKKQRFLGLDPLYKKKIFAKIARFGPVIQMGEFELNQKEKPKFSPLLVNQTIESISLQEALKLIELPKLLGKFENKEILLKMNKYNIFIQHNNQYITINQELFFNSSINIKQAIDIILKNRHLDKKK
ncbi:type I DNA topoisomerase [Blattabacterium cuenoti]|uniref:type I DNA topoisomerase n=1 Tax=Blattabacterium cuenoti TaxID=1653831 RepID=UPI00163C0D75|nr:type I DNA topoisomerase [Blattabacterium cuenoti]